MLSSEHGPQVRRKIFAAALALLVVAFGSSVWPVLQAPVEPPAPPLIVNDVSQLNPIRVSRIIEPTTTEQIVEAVRGHAGPISIGGARHSMGDPRRDRRTRGRYILRPALP